MKQIIAVLLFFLAVLFSCHPPSNPPSASEFASVAHVDSGKPMAVMMTAYRTTMLADGQDRTLLRIALTDSAGREITSAADTIRVYIEGDARITRKGEDDPLPVCTDTAGQDYSEATVKDGLCWLDLYAGTDPGIVRVKVTCDTLWPSAHEIHTIPGDVALIEPGFEQITRPVMDIGRMIGADISFLPELEDRGVKFYDRGKEQDAIKILRDHGFNYIRLRIFVHPEAEKGYAPGKGYCGLGYTLAMARRVHDAGMKLLLNFHYSDYWADPQQQNKPQAWAGLDFETLKDSVRVYTSSVLSALEKQGTPAAMVQVGNEVNHGLLWPDGHISQPDKLTELLRAGVEGVQAVDPDMPVMMHLALGGQHDEAVFWLDNMIARDLPFDIIGLSYYPRWHGTLDDLKANLTDLSGRYKKYVNVVEYSVFRKEVNDIVFNVPEDMGKGTCIWEPLGWWVGLFDRQGVATDEILVYDELRDRYLSGK